MTGLRGILIDNAASWWRFYSVHAYACSLLIGAAVAWLSKDYPEIYAQIPGWGLAVLGLVMMFGFVVARLVRQGGASPDTSGAGWQR